MNEWDKTRISYINWLSNTPLRKEFAKKINFNDLSLWWISELMDKNNRLHHKWYENLNKTINKKKIEKNHINYFFLIFKLFKGLFFKLALNIFYKIFFSNNKKSIKYNKKHCFYSLMINVNKYKNKYIDRTYGLTHLYKNKEKIFLIELPQDFTSISKLKEIKLKLKKHASNYLILNSEVNFFDIIKIYFLTLVLFFKTLVILNKKNYFIIKNSDCSSILKPILITSFFGQIQNNLINGIAIQNSLVKIKPKTFITNYTFYPGGRNQFHFAKKANIKKIININLAIYSSQNIFWNFNKNDFSESINSYYSPKPDLFVCRGLEDFKKIKSTFKNLKSFQIGCLKVDARNYKIVNKNLKKKGKKIITILTGEADWKSIIKILNKCNLNDFIIYIDPHPLFKDKTINYFKNNFKHEFFSIINIKKLKLIQKSDYLIFGDTQLGVELAIRNFNVIRVYDHEFIPQYDINQRIPTACNEKQFLNILKKKKNKFNKNKILEKNYFYKYDSKATLRLQVILNKV